jgi:hypothetical protein
MEDLRVLFILKFRENYGESEPYSYSTYFSSGLYWSAKFVVDMLNQEGITTKLVQVVDNNDIDREVAHFQADVVIIEALWVIPSKFDILKKLHPNVTWVVRLHSNTPFLALEGIAIDWLKGYASRGVLISVNDKRMMHDAETRLGPRSCVYLPNFYPVHRKTASRGDSDILKIACFGAIRPMKNQLIQAIAAMRYAHEQGKILHFYVNGTRMEQGGENIRKNLRALFSGTLHKLIEEDWLSHDHFLRKLRHMDLGMQVSLSETFSIVAADYVSVGLPIVVSHEIPWADWLCRVTPTNGGKITDGIKRALALKTLNVYTNRSHLKSYSNASRDIWIRFLRGL